MLDNPNSRLGVLERMRHIFDAMPDGVVTIARGLDLHLRQPARARDRSARDVIAGQATSSTLFPGNREEPFYSTYHARDGRTASRAASRPSIPQPLNLLAQGGSASFRTKVTASSSSSPTSPLHKRAQQELVASEERYRVLADLNPQAIWAADGEGNVTYGNQGLLAYLGLRQEDLGGDGWLQSIAPADRERVLRVWMQSVRTGEDYEIEAMLRYAATGEFRYWHLRAAAVRDAAGAIVQWLGVGSDVHERKTSDAALRAERTEAERRRAELEAVYASTPVALALLDPVDFRFLNLNQFEAELLGLPKDQILGRRLDEVAPIPGLLDMLRSVAEGNTIKDYLLEGELEPTGTMRRSWLVNYSPVYAAGRHGACDFFGGGRNYQPETGGSGVDPKREAGGGGAAGELDFARNQQPARSDYEPALPDRARSCAARRPEDLRAHGAVGAVASFADCHADAAFSSPGGERRPR